MFYSQAIIPCIYFVFTVSLLAQVQFLFLWHFQISNPPLLSLQFMNPRQRNIPVTTKQQSEVQTDVKLIESYLLESRLEHRQSQPTVTLSQTYSRSGLLRPFTDNQLLRELGKSIQELKESEQNQGAFARRLEILEEQIAGLLKRDFLLSSVAEGSEGWNSYYLTLNEKEKVIIRLQNEKIYSDLKIRRLRDRIEEQEREVDRLRNSVVATQKLGEENKLYASFYERLNGLVNNSKRKGVDFQALLNEQVVPMMADFSLNLTALNRTINRDIHASIRPTVSALAREFDRLLKEQQFSEDKISETVSNLVVNFKAAQGVEHMRQQFDLASRAALAESNYRNIIALFRNEIDNLKHQNPNLKTAERIDVLLRRLEAEGVEVVDCKGWMNLVQPEVKVVEVSASDAKLKQLIATLGSEFKKVYSSFPQLKSHLSVEIATILESQLLAQLIEGGSLDWIKEIIVHQVDSVKVDNIYKYSSTKDNQLNFRLRVLIKALLQELEKVKKAHGIEVALDEGVLALLREQALEGIDIEAVIGLFRPPCKFVEVPIVVEKPVYHSKTYEQGVAIRTEMPVLLQQNRTEVVVLNREVPVYIQKPIDGVVVSHVGVSLEAQKAVPVQVSRQVVAERIVESAVEVPVLREKAVAMYEREEVVREVPVDRIVETVEVREVERVVPSGDKEYIEVEKIVEVPHYIYETRQQIKEVEVRVPHIVRQPEYREVEKIVNHIIEKNEVVNIVEQVAVQIKVPEIKLVELTEIRDKIIVTNEYNEVVKEIPVIREKELIREIPKEIFIERSHFIKGDQVEVIREVEVLVEKPIVHEILTTKDVEIEKVVPLYITEQVPLVTELSVPYFSERVRELQVEKVRLIPVKEEIVRQVNVDRPVPVVVEKEVVRVEKQIVEKIIEKIVEVPRVVEVERIVEKIVVVPRIVEKIVEVPKIVERIVVVEQPILQIVEIPVPQIIIQVVEKIVEVIVEKPVIEYVKVIERVEVEKIVERIVERERIVEVEVQRRIPYEVVREVPVPTYRDRIEYQRVEIHDTKVETIEVQVPIIVQEKVPFIQEKTIVTEHIIEKPVIEKSVVEREVPVYTDVEKLVIKEIYIEKAVLNEIVKEIPIQTIVYRDVPQIVEVIRDKLVELLTIKEVPKEIILQNDKIVHHIHEKLVEVPVNQIVTTPQLIEVPRIINLVHYKQIAVEVPVREERIKRDVVETIKEIEVIREVPVEVEICREKLKEVVTEVKQFLTSEIIKEIQTEVEVRMPSENTVVNLPGETIVQTHTNTERQVEVQERIVERLVEKIVMLPQIVEVVRNIHHISEVNSLGMAVDVDINVQTEMYLGVTTELRKGLLELLSTFKANVGRQPDLKNLIVIIEKYIKYIDDWIKFPKLVEVPKEVTKQVEKERIVLVPTPDKEKEATLSFILEKLIGELKRIRDSHKITLGLDQELLRMLFSERKSEEGLSSKLVVIQEDLKKKYSRFGEWSQSNPFLVNAFLQDHFALQSVIQQANRQQESQSAQIDSLRSKLENATNQYSNLLCFNRKMFDDNSSLIRTLEKYRSTIDEQEFTENISTHRKFYEEIIEEKHSVIFETIKKSTIIEERYSRDVSQIEEKDGHFGELVGKLSRYEGRTQQLQLKNKRLQNELSKLQQQSRIKISTIKRLESEFQQRVSRAKEQFAKSPNLNKEIFEENKKLQEKIRTLEREIASEKSNIERVKKELQRSSEGQKRDYDRELQRRQRQVKDAGEKSKKEVEREVNRLKSDFEKIRKQKEKLEVELVQTRKKSSQEIKSIRQLQMSSASDKYNQLLNENVDIRRKNDSLEAQYEKLKKGALQNNSANEREIARMRSENQKLVIERKEYDKQKKQGFMDLPQETQIVNRNIELEKKLKQVEAELDKLKTKDEASVIEIKTLKEKVKKLEIELEIARKEVEAAQKSRLQSTAYQSGFKPTVSIVQNVEGSVVRSPRSPGYKGSFDKGYMSPQESSLSREERIEQFGSSSSRVSQSSEDQGLPSYYSSQMTLREFIDAKHGDEKERDMYVTLVMIKVIEKIEEEADKGIYNSYTPSNIFLSNFNTKHLDKLTVKFGAQITNRNSKADGVYLSPQVLAGATSTRKSIVFCLGVILDELIHGSTFFRSTEDIQNLQSEFKVRGEKLNPILKNTLFEMMNKEPTKRLDLIEAKRRLSLQKYITTESRSTLTVTSRAGTVRRTTEES